MAVILVRLSDGSRGNTSRVTLGSYPYRLTITTYSPERRLIVMLSDQLSSAGFDRDPTFPVRPGFMRTLAKVLISIYD